MTDLTRGRGQPFQLTPRLFTLSASVDCAATPLTAAAHPLINIPAMTWVLFVRARCTAAEGAAATIDLGDAATPDGWYAGADVNAATTHVLTNANDTYGALAGAVELPFGKLYRTAGTIDVTPSAALDAAAFSVEALCCRLG